MKVVAFNGSPRKEGNTYLLVQKVFGELHKEGIETEVRPHRGKISPRMYGMPSLQGELG